MTMLSAIDDDNQNYLNLIAVIDGSKDQVKAGGGKDEKVKKIILTLQRAFGATEEKRFFVQLDDGQFKCLFCEAKQTAAVKEGPNKMRYHFYSGLCQKKPCVDPSRTQERADLVTRYQKLRETSKAQGPAAPSAPSLQGAEHESGLASPSLKRKLGEQEEERGGEKRPRLDIVPPAGEPPDPWAFSF